MLNYEWKIIQEAFWAGIGGLTVAASALLAGGIDVGDDPRVWLATAAGALARGFFVGVGVVLVRAFGGKSNK